MKLVLAEVYKSYQMGQSSIAVIQNLNLAIENGKKVAIIGPSGSGKSTLLSLLSGIIAPDKGSIAVGDTDIAKLSENERTIFRGQNIGIVFQNFHLVEHLSALENVRLPLEVSKKVLSDQSIQLLTEVGLKERANHFPNQLSGGEQQRVAIARALVTDPRLLLADEPTGSLDLDTGERVTKLLFDILKLRNKTSVIVTHNLELANLCDQIYQLSHGGLVKIK